LLHDTASKNQIVFIVRAAVAELRQWLAEKKYGVKLCVASFRSCPVHRYELPFSCVKSISATCLVAFTKAWLCGTHATSMLHAPELPMSSTVFWLSDFSSDGSTTWCDTLVSVSATPASCAAAGACSSITAVSPRSTGDQYDPYCAVCAATALAGTGPNTAASPALLAKRSSTSGSTVGNRIATRSAAAPVDCTSTRAARLPSGSVCHVMPSSAMDCDPIGIARPNATAKGFALTAFAAVLPPAATLRALSDFKVPRSVAVGSASVMRVDGALDGSNNAAEGASFDVAGRYSAGGTALIAVPAATAATAVENSTKAVDSRVSKRIIQVSWISVVARRRAAHARGIASCFNVPVARTADMRPARRPAVPRDCSYSRPVSGANPAARARRCAR